MMRVISTVLACLIPQNDFLIGQNAQQDIAPRGLFRIASGPLDRQPCRSLNRGLLGADTISSAQAAKSMARARNMLLHGWSPMSSGSGGRLGLTQAMPNGGRLQECV